jgi:hypothetical protein
VLDGADLLERRLLDQLHQDDVWRLVRGHDDGQQQLRRLRHNVYRRNDLRER